MTKMKTKTYLNLMATASLCGLLGGLTAGCAVDAQTADSEELDEIQQLLNSDVNTCGKAQADKTYSSVFSFFTSPSNYKAGKNGCGKAYFVDVDNYRTNNGGKYNAVTVGGTAPTTQSACEATRVMVYAFKKPTDPKAQPTVAGSKSRYGVWHQAEVCDPSLICDRESYCILPTVYLESWLIGQTGDLNLTTGQNYKFALSVRDTGPDPHVMKKIKIYSANRQRPAG